jgi:hypothetical protein
MTPDLSHGAREALINANPQSGKLPQGTPDMVRFELQEAGLVGKLFGLTLAGRMVRQDLIEQALEGL